MTAYSLSAITYELLANPDKLAKLKEELVAALPDPDTVPTLAVVEKLPYFNAAIQEGLRLHPGARCARYRGFARTPQAKLRVAKAPANPYTAQHEPAARYAHAPQYRNPRTAELPVPSVKFHKDVGQAVRRGPAETWFLAAMPLGPC